MGIDYQKANDYFDKKIKFGAISYVMFALAAISLILAIAVEWWLVFLTALFIFLAMRFRTFAVSDAEYDGMIAKLETDVESHALDKLGITKEMVAGIAPVFAVGYSYTNVRTREGEDGKLRTNRYLVTYIGFSDTQVHYFSSAVVTTSNNNVNSTHVCCYKDIVSVITGIDVITTSGKKTVEVFSLKLVTSGGSTITVELNDNTHQQETINSLRDIIKRKKA